VRIPRVQFTVRQLVSLVAGFAFLFGADSWAPDDVGTCEV
jgi:hypothetical protein